MQETAATELSGGRANRALSEHSVERLDFLMCELVHVGNESSWRVNAWPVFALCSTAVLVSGYVLGLSWVAVAGLQKAF